MNERTEHPLLTWERSLWGAGCTWLAGIDEAGRGALAGPVVSAVVVIGPDSRLVAGVDDSKKLTPRKREALYPEIRHTARAVGVGMVHHQDIDRLNIYQATIRSMEQAIAGLEMVPDHLLVDGMALPGQTLPQTKIIDGDAQSYCIAAASIIAKVTRDRLMCELDQRYPLYGFARHKGYGTREHMHSIAQYQPCEIHRRTFYPVSNYPVIS